jgi:hypothetical protein
MVDFYEKKLLVGEEQFRRPKLFSSFVPSKFMEDLEKDFLLQR